MLQKKLILKTVTVLFLLVFKMSLFSTGLSAQGTLGRIRKSARKEEKPAKSAEKEERQKSKPQKESKPNKNRESTLGSIVQSVRRNDRPESSTRETHPSGNRNRGRQHSHRPRRRPRDRGIYFSSQAFCPQPQVVEHVHIYEQPPLIEQSSDVPGQVLLIDETGTLDPVASTVVKPQPGFEENFEAWSLRMTAFYGSNFDHLSQGGFNMLIQGAEGLGLDVGVTTFRERGFAFRDHLWLGDANIVFGANLGDLRTRIGLGVNWLADPYGADAGFNLTAGFDKAFGSRWTASGEIDFGSIGDTDLLHTQISLGYRMKHSEIVAGYDYYNIGGTGIDGWFSGIRFRF